MAARAAWVLNLDADVELAKGSGYTRSARVEASMRPHVERLATALLGPEDILLRAPEDRAEGFVGRAFCPTPLALARLSRAGAKVDPHPSFEVLRAVNSRSFSAALGQTMPGALFVTDEASALAMLASAPPLSSSWRIKRAFGMAGRGHRVVLPGAVTEADRQSVRAGMSEGGVQIEPNLPLVAEYAVHGRIDPEGGVRFGRVCIQRCDAHGQWLSTEPLVEGDPGIVRALMSEAEHTSRALVAASYVGPFNVDAFTYRDAARYIQLQPRSEINARYSMGYPVGFGLAGSGPT